MRSLSMRLPLVLVQRFKRGPFKAKKRSQGLVIKAASGRSNSNSSKCTRTASTLSRLLRRTARAVQAQAYLAGCILRLIQVQVCALRNIPLLVSLAGIPPFQLDLRSILRSAASVRKSSHTRIRPAENERSTHSSDLLRIQVLQSRAYWQIQHCPLSRRTASIGHHLPSLLCASSWAPMHRNQVQVFLRLAGHLCHPEA